MQEKKGISLIVLVITIIVMIVLAGAIILSLNNAGIIEKSNEAVDLTNIANAREFAQTKWAEAYLERDKTQEALEEYVLTELAEVGITEQDYEILVTEKGVTVNKKGETKIIKFSINDVEYQAEEGMTWEQWEKSSYNTLGSEGLEWENDDGSCIYNIRYYIKDGKLMLAEGIERTEGHKLMEMTYKITPDVHYFVEEACWD